MLLLLGAFLSLPKPLGAEGLGEIDFAPPVQLNVPIEYNAICRDVNQDGLLELAYSFNQGGEFVRRAQLGANTVRYRDGGLQPATLHTYGIRAVNDLGASEYSPEASGTTLEFIRQGANPNDRFWWGISAAEAATPALRHPARVPFGSP